MNFYFNRMELKNADFFQWKDKKFITIREFIYLIAGYEPLPLEYEDLPNDKSDPYFHLKNETFKEFYKKVKEQSRSIPKTKTDEINFQPHPVTGETQYEVGFLIKWIEGTSIHLISNPIITAFKEQITDLNSEDSLIKKIISSKLYPVLKWIDENFYKDKKSISPSGQILCEIEENYKKRDNVNIFLSKNECELVHNFMRIIYGVKK